MGTFFRVIYTKILYRIPLKYLLILLAVVAVFIASFSNADLVGPTLLQTYTTRITDSSYTNNNYDFLCLKNVSCSSLSILFNFNHGNGAYQNKDAVISDLICGPSHIIYFTTSNNCTFEIYGYKYTNYTKAQCKSTYGLIEDSECVGMDSMQCQLQYNLIPVSSVDSNYCQTNNLCPTCSTCPVNTGLSLTDLYINNILHVGAPTIIMNIPEEIDRDYAYTEGGTIMNIDVVGYNQDTEYIESLIDINSYKPTSEDFTSVFSLFGEYGGLLVACLFVILLFYFIKKAFK